MGLNFTSTTPSVRAVSFLTHQGNVPAPDCFSTFGGLGAVGSFSTAHFGAPRPVTPAVQPPGSEPTASWSKVIVSATAGSDAINSNDAIIIVFTRASNRNNWSKIARRRSRARTLGDRARGILSRPWRDAPAGPLECHPPGFP